MHRAAIGHQQPQNGGEQVTQRIGLAIQATQATSTVAVFTSFHEPPGPSNRRLLWESGAEVARTPDASRPPGVSEQREAFGVRPIYRRFPPAGHVLTQPSI